MSADELSRIESSDVASEQRALALIVEDVLLDGPISAQLRIKEATQIEALKNKWELLVELHDELTGDRYSFDREPTVDLAERFVTHSFEENGMNDFWGERVVPYKLAKFVFPLVGYPSWVGLGEPELEEMQKPYKIALMRQWRSLKASRIRSVQQRQRVLCAWASTLASYEIGTALTRSAPLRSPPPASTRMMASRRRRMTMTRPSWMRMTRTRPSWIST